MVTFERTAPVLPVRSVSAALEHYRKLGFTAEAYDDEAGADARGSEPVYGFLARGSVRIHVTRFTELDPAANTSACYVYVDDADALYGEWRAAGVAGRLIAPVDTPYGLREMAHIDPDGNLLRVGSEMARCPAP